MEASSLDETSSRSSRKNSFNLESQTSKSSSVGSLGKKGSIQFKTADSGSDIENAKMPNDASLKVPHKIISNWKSACDRTKDKTKDLLKRWRTLPDTEVTNNSRNDENSHKDVHPESSWSVHVWTTWVDRFNADSPEEQQDTYSLTPVQIVKFTHFFNSLLDHDQDNLISNQDFENLMERLRHFADWSVNSTEFNVLREIERGFISTFLSDISDERFGFEINDLTYITKEGWLHKWSKLVKDAKTLGNFPIWIQFFVKVLFKVINRGGTGVITRDELRCFYSSVLCLDTMKVGEILDIAYQAMTSNGDHPLHFRSFQLCFSNYLLGTHPNGSGYYILGAPPNETSSAMFPVDYSALNAQPEDLEQYMPDHRPARGSVIV